MGHIIITENDVSKWKDKTGELYHFPRKFLRLFSPGTKAIYYKGQMKEKIYKHKRLSEKPHYFGIAEIGEIIPDSESTKDDYYAKIIKYIPFSKPVYAKQSGGFLETIPNNRKSNYWRDGARRIDKNTYLSIINLSDIKKDGSSDLNDLFQGTGAAFESEIMEGAKKQQYSSFYERDPKLRQQALLIHGYTCMVCKFNFEETYGEIGKGFIHVHHVKPLSSSGETVVNPKEDLIVVCPNCHSMIHRYKYGTINHEELKNHLAKP